MPRGEGYMGYGMGFAVHNSREVARQIRITDGCDGANARKRAEIRKEQLSEEQETDRAMGALTDKIKTAIGIELSPEAINLIKKNIRPIKSGLRHVEISLKDYPDFNIPDNISTEPISKDDAVIRFYRPRTQGKDGFLDFELVHTVVADLRASAEADKDFKPVEIAREKFNFRQ